MNKTVISILHKVLVNHFYQVNTGFFLFAFFVLFGVVAPGQLISYHLSLIQGMLQSPLLLGSVIFLWLIYTFKCIHDVTKKLKEPDQHFLFALHTLTGKQQFFYLLYVQVLIYLPVGLYALVVAAMALKQQNYWAGVAVIISNICWMTLSVFTCRFSLQKKEWLLSGMLPTIRYAIPKPLFLIPLWFIWYHHKQMLLTTKLFTLFVLYAFINLYEPDRHDIRPLLLIILVTGMAHCTMVWQIRQFEEKQLSFTRNLPVSLFKRFTSLLFLLLLMLLPELVVIWKAYPLHFQLADFPQMLLLAISLPSFLYSILLMNDTDSDSYFRMVFGIGGMLFFMILYNPGILLPLFLTAISFVFFSSHFYTFEKRIS